MRQEYYLNGKEIHEPDNYQELFIELNYDRDGSSEAVTVNQWNIGHGGPDFGNNDGLNVLQTSISRGLTGGPGVTEGVPFQIYISGSDFRRYLIFNGYLDLWQARVMSGVISCPAVEQGKLDWLNQVADSVSFEFLYETGKITTADFYAVPYVINRKQKALELIITIVTLYTLAQQLKKSIGYLIDTINDYDIIYISTIIRVIAQIIQIVVLIASMVPLLVDLYNMIIQPVKYHYGMFVADLMEKGLNHFGLQLKSSILQAAPYNDLFILPEKFAVFEKNTGIHGGVTGLIKPRTVDKKGYYRGTFGQFMRQIKQLFNARIIIRDNVLFFEKQDYDIPAPRYVMPLLDDMGYTYNYEDYKSNIVLSFATDIGDRNTIQEYQGTSVQVIHRPKVVINQKMVLAKGLEDINFGFALGKRKTTLNWVENRIETFNTLIAASSKVLLSTIEKAERAAKGAVKAVNKVIKALKLVGISTNFNLNVPNFPQGIKTQIKQIGLRADGSRIGMLKMESDYISVPKIILVKRNVIDRQRVLSAMSTTDLSAVTMWNRFHYFKTFVEDRSGQHNQKLIYDFENIPFTFDDYEKVRTSNRIFHYDGSEAELISLKWNPEQQTASGKYRVKNKYTNNLSLTIIEPDGK